MKEKGRWEKAEKIQKKAKKEQVAQQMNQKKCAELQTPKHSFKPTRKTVTMYMWIQSVWLDLQVQTTIRYKAREKNLKKRVKKRNSKQQK